MTINIFADLGFSPEKAEILRLRSELMLRIRREIRARDLTQEQAAKLFGVNQPRISHLVRGKIQEFSIDALVTMLARAGVFVVMHEAYGEGVATQAHAVASSAVADVAVQLSEGGVNFIQRASSEANRSLTSSRSTTTTATTKSRLALAA